jgi:hypothetical protein
MHLDRLLRALEVRIDNFLVCQACAGWRLAFDAEPRESVHYVLMGEGALHVPGMAPLPIRQDSFLIVPGGLPYGFGPIEGGMREVRTRVPPAAAKGEVPVIRAGEGDGCLTAACGTVSTTYGGGLRLFAHLKAPLIESLSDEESLRAVSAGPGRARGADGRHAHDDRVFAQAVPHRSAAPAHQDRQRPAPAGFPQ